MKRIQTILVIDDDVMIHRLVSARLKGLDVHIQTANNGLDGLHFARCHPVDLILLDVSMPDMDGFEACRQLRDHPATRDIPVIFLTGSDNTVQKTRGFELGAVDYVTKPFEPAELNARVRSALRMQALLEALEMQANTDALTGLPNRAAFHRRLTACIERTRANPDGRFAVLFIDLDRFKHINDSLGHAVGDQLLVAVADLLRNAVRRDDHESRHDANRRTDYIARMGGDEFTILLENIPHQDMAAQLSDRIRHSIIQPLAVCGHQVTVDCSIGIRCCDAACSDADVLLRDSDTAMYRAKADGKGRCVVFDNQMHQEVVDRLELEQDLRRAIDADELQLVYQPIVDLEAGRLHGFESLLRWHHPTRGTLSPNLFIPIAEETGLIVPIGRWAMRACCRQIADWRNRFPNTRQLTGCFNVSKYQITNDDLVKLIDLALTDFNIEPHCLTIEVTESAITYNAATVIPVLETLRKRGIRLAMDDFGTGYSSLASLHRFPIDVLKIDREFILTMSQSRAHVAVVYAIVMLAANLGMSVVAEGVETNEHLVQLQAIDCAFGQGYLFGRPVPADQFERDYLIDSPANKLTQLLSRVTASSTMLP